MLRRSFLAFIGCLPFFKPTEVSAKESKVIFHEKKSSQHHLVLIDDDLTFYTVLNLESLTIFELLNSISNRLIDHKIIFASIQQSNAPWNKTDWVTSNKNDKDKLKKLIRPETLAKPFSESIRLSLNEKDTLILYSTRDSSKLSFVCVNHFRVDKK